MLRQGKHLGISRDFGPTPPHRPCPSPPAFGGLGTVLPGRDCGCSVLKRSAAPFRGALLCRGLGCRAEWAGVLAARGGGVVRKLNL